MQRMAEPVMPLMSWGSLTEAFRQSEAPSDSAMAGGEPKARKSAAKPKPSDVNDALRLMRLSLFLGEGRLRPRFCATGRSPRLWDQLAGSRHQWDGQRAHLSLLPIKQWVTPPGL